MTAPAAAPATAEEGLDTLVRYRAGDGGALFALMAHSAGSSSVSIDAVKLAQNGAVGSGGAVAVWGAVQLAVRGSEAALNAARAAGGCVVAGSGATVAIEDSALLECSAGGPSARAAAAGAGAGAAPSSSSSDAAAGPSAAAAAAEASAAAACASADASSPSASHEDGGALALLSGASATLTRATLSLGSAAAAGGCASLGDGASIDARGSTVANCSARAGGAVALRGRNASFSASASVFASNSAFAGGFLAFSEASAPSEGSATAAALRLSNLSLTGNAAAVGGLFALSDGASVFDEPQCEGCEVALVPATSYGDRVASLPARVAVDGPAAVRTGSPFEAHARLFDAFGQQVGDYSAGVGLVECAAHAREAAAPPPVGAGGAGSAAAPLAPAPSAPACGSGDLHGQVRAFFGCGSALLSLLRAPTRVLLLPPSSSDR